MGLNGFIPLIKIKLFRSRGVLWYRIKPEVPNHSNVLNGPQIKFSMVKPVRKEEDVLKKLSRELDLSYLFRQFLRSPVYY